MADDHPWRLLPPDLIELQIGQIDLLMAMYENRTNMSVASNAFANSRNSLSGTPEML